MDYFFNGKRIGSLKDGIFRKRVQKSKHLMKLNDSWGIQYETLQDLKDRGCTEIRVLETEDNQVYSVSMDDYYKKSIVENFGEGQQAFLTRSEWAIHTPTKN